MKKKYELIDYNETTKLYRIKALKSFGDISVNELGGYVAGEHNLSHEGNCWIYDNATVCGNARVYGESRVYDNATVCGDAHVYGESRVYGNATVCGDAHVYGNAFVAEKQYVMFSRLESDITNNQNKIESIQCQTNLIILNGEVYCSKLVGKDLTSLYDNNFQYKVGEWVEEPNYDSDHTQSCAAGLHFSHLSYWEMPHHATGKILYCKVPLEDVIAVQEGKIRAKRAFVIGVCDNKAY